MLAESGSVEDAGKNSLRLPPLPVLNRISEPVDSNEQHLKHGQMIGTVAWPEPAILAAGAFGGPIVIGSLTPLRNACTLAAQDAQSSFSGIYGRVFSRGLLAGWTGAATPACAAAIQFTTLGPGFYIFLGLLGTPTAAVAAGAMAETLVTYAPATRNAQLMHNIVSVEKNQVPVRPMIPVGPGFSILVMRNFFANSGIRVLSTPFSTGITRVTLGEEASRQSELPERCRMVGDFLASVCCGAVSMPFNQLYNYQVTSAASLAASPVERAKLGLQFLKSQYIVRRANGSIAPSRLVFRDMALRSLYIGCMFSSYAAVERLALSLAKKWV